MHLLCQAQIEWFEPEQIQEVLDQQWNRPMEIANLNDSASGHALS
jgi:hypothetical protein